MKKIIAAIIRFFMPKAVRKHEIEEKARRIHNANVLQHLLDAEHDLRDRVNEHQHIPSTTKKAVLMANKYGLSRYNSAKALKEADFRQIRERINDNEDEPDSLLIINPYSTNATTNDATNDAHQKSKF